MNHSLSRLLKLFFHAKLASLLICCAITLIANRPAEAQRKKLDIKVNADSVKSIVGTGVYDQSKKYTNILSAITRFKNRKPKEAEQFLEKARKKYPTLPPIDMMLAKLFYMGKDNQNGMVYLEKAIGAAPADPEAYITLANINLQERRYTTAKLLAEKCLTLTEKVTVAKRKKLFHNQSLTVLASVAINHKQWVEAEKQLRAMLESNPDVSLSAHQFLGKVLYHQGNSKSAIAEFTAAYTEDKEKATAPEVAMALLYQKDEKESTAKQLMERAIKNYPKNLNVHLVIASWGIQSNNLTLARKSAEEAVKIDPDSLTAKLSLAIVARHQGDTATATKYFEAAHLQSPSNFSASNNLALILIESKDEKQQSRAQEFAGMSYERYPMNGRSKYRYEAASTMGWILYKKNYFNQAAQLLYAVANTGQLNPDSAYYLANFLHDQRRDSEAIRILESAVGSDQPFFNRKAAQSLLDQLNKANK